MKILYVGELYPQDYIPTSRTRMEELERAGHEIIPIDFLRYLGWGGRWLGWPFRRLRWGPPLWRFNQEILRLAQQERPDVLWIEKGVWVCPETLRRAQTLGTRLRVHYTLDPAIVYHHSRHFLASIPEYDLLVTTKAYEMDLYRQYGARDILLQYPSYDSNVHVPQSPTMEEARRYGADVVFIGTYTPGRERYLKPLTGLGIDLALWGNQWQRCQDIDLKRFSRGAGVGGRDYALALSCAKIGLGLLSPLCPDRSTTRSLEIPACGTFLLAPRTDEHQTLFEEGKEAEFFSSEQELIDKVRFYLTHAEERKRIAVAGWERCMASGYSSADRVQAVMDRVEQRLRGMDLSYAAEAHRTEMTRVTKSPEPQA